MVRGKARVGTTEKLLGYAILIILVLIAAGLLIQQTRFNPAVIVAQRAPLLKGRAPAASGQAAAATGALLPEVPGFTPLAPGEGYGPENLSDKIDGKAELYLSAGFKEMACRNFGLGAPGGAHVEVYLYDMGSAPNAYAVFSGQRRPGAAPLTLTGNAYATANALFFTKGRFYVEIVADRPAEAFKDSLMAYAAALLAKMPVQGEAEDQTALFPKEGLSRDTVRLCAADTFGCEGLNNMFTGEYNLKGGKATAFIARRDTPDEARAEAKRYLDFLTANGYQKVETPGVPEGAAAFRLEDSYEIVFIQGRTVAGVHDATSLAAAAELAAELETGLKSKP